MITKILSLLLVLGSVAVYAMPLQNPQWYKATLDGKRAERFIAIADYKGTPLVSYFDSPSEGGLLVQKATTGNWGLLDNLLFYINGKRDWTEGALDPTKYTGRFISTVSKNPPNGEAGIYAVYQESEVGREKLMYAQYDGKTWKSEVVDDVSNGANVGLFPSISLIKQCDSGSKTSNSIPNVILNSFQDLFGIPKQVRNDSCLTTPVVFYHTEQGLKFGFARRNLLEGGQPKWDKKTLETGVGWLTTSATCGNLPAQAGTVYVAYRGRDTDDIYLGTFSNNDTKWSSRKLGIKTSTGLAIVASRHPSNSCTPYLAYTDEVDNKVKVLDINSGKTSTIGSSQDSRISLASSPDALYALYQGPKGLVLAKSQNNQDWTEEIIDSEKTAGSYNALAVDENNNISLAYISGTSVKYAEYNTTALAAAKRTQKIASGLLLVLGAAILTSKIIKRQLSVTKKPVRKGKR